MNTELYEQGQKMAKTSLIMGILALVLFPFSELFFVFALINGIKSKNRSEERKMPGKAFAGIILAIAGMVLFFSVSMYLSLAPYIKHYESVAQEAEITSVQREIHSALQTTMVMIPTIDESYIEPRNGEYSLEVFLEAAGPIFTQSFYEIMGITDVSDLGYSSITVKKVGSTDIRVTVEE